VGVTPGSSSAGQALLGHEPRVVGAGNDHVNTPAQHCQVRDPRATVMGVAPDKACRQPLPG